jgi:thioredoxin reductase (NADPH)
MKRFDCLILGGGSGGMAMARSLRSLCKDWRIAMVDSRSNGLGGTCVNVGCIPKKLLHDAANFASRFAHFHSAFGVDDNSADARLHIEWSKLLANVNNYVRSLNWQYRKSFRSLDVDVLHGSARFVDSHRIEICKSDASLDSAFENKVADRSPLLIDFGAGPTTPHTSATTTVEADRIVVACGVEPAPAHFDVVDHDARSSVVIDSDQLFWRGDVTPRRVAIVGGGYIALEAASFLNGFGADVSVYLRSRDAHVLRGMDRQSARMVAELMERSGVRFVGDARVTRVAGDTLHYERDGQSHDERGFDTVLMATGRRPAAPDGPDALHFDAAGVRVDEHGFVLTDARTHQTSVPHIYAIGDVVSGAPQLTPVAVRSARQAAASMVGSAAAAHSMQNTPLTSCVYTLPSEYAFCGLSEQEAIEQLGGAEHVRCYNSRYTPLDASMARVASTSTPADRRRSNVFSTDNDDDDDELLAHSTLLAKVVCRSDNDRVLGMHFVGDNAAEIVQTLSLALSMSTDESPLLKRHLDHMLAIHPSAAEEFTVLAPATRDGHANLKAEGCGGGGSC